MVDVERHAAHSRDSVEFGRLSLSEASSLYRLLPASLQVPSLAPEVAAADAERLEGVTPTYWGFRQGSEFALKSFLLSSVEVDGREITDIQSPYGSGGVLSTFDNTSFRSAVRGAFVQWARQEGVAVEFVRMHPLLKAQSDFVQDAWINRSTVVVPLGSDLMANYPSRKRSYLRSEMSQKPKLHEFNQPYDANKFAQLYTENMEVVKASREYFFPQKYFRHLLSYSFARVWGLVYPGASGLLAAAITLENDSSGIVEYHLGASRRQVGRRSLELLIHWIATLYGERGYRTLYLGGGRTSNSDDSLLRFKRSFSRTQMEYRIGRTVFLPEIYCGLPGYSPAEAQRRVLFYRV